MRFKEQCGLILILFIIVLGAGCISSPPNHDMTTTPTTFPTPVITPLRYATIEEARSRYADYTVPEYLPEGYIFNVAYYVDGPDRRIDTYFSPSIDRRRQPPPLQDMSIYLHQRQDPTPFCSGSITGEVVIVDINGYEGSFVQGSKLTWYAGNYSFCLHGPFNQSEMEKIAESIPIDRRNKTWEPPTVTPGKQHLGIPVWYYPGKIDIRSGETKEVQIILKTNAKGQGLVIQRIVPVRSAKSNEEIPMPQYLNVSLSPSEYAVSPNETYNSTLTIHTEPQLPEGEYVFRANMNMTDIIKDRRWITVNVSGEDG